MYHFTYFQRSKNVKIIHFSMGGNAALYCSRKVPEKMTKMWDEALPQRNDPSKTTTNKEEVKHRWRDLISNGKNFYENVEVESFEREEMVIAVTCNADLKSSDAVYQFCSELERKFHEHFFDVV